MVLANTLFETVSMSGVIRAISTTQDVNPEAHNFALRCCSPFDKAFSPEHGRRVRANGFGGHSSLQKPRHHALRQFALQWYLHAMSATGRCGECFAFEAAHLGKGDDMVAGRMNDFQCVADL